MSQWLHRVQSERGSAPIQFVVGLPILVLISLAVIQMVLVLHIRATLTSAAAEGARAAALSGSSPARGVQRIKSALAGDIAQSAVDRVTIRARTLSGARVMEATISAHMPIVGLIGAVQVLIHGHALEET
ncbi:MAG: TadE/TadG family type IV pilus assembly protein [Actinomycetes bacterium]